MMKWEQLLSLKRQGDTSKRLRKEQDDTRLGFEVDYDRIIFSSEFRLLQDKTQVIPLSKTDFVHTRLTHSLEVSVVGRSIGRLVGKKILEKYPHLQEIHGYQLNDFGAIVAAACLSHDIGNPPFGHSGEKAIGEYFVLLEKAKNYIDIQQACKAIIEEKNDSLTEQLMPVIKRLLGQLGILGPLGLLALPGCSFICMSRFLGRGTSPR